MAKAVNKNNGMRSGAEDFFRIAVENAESLHPLRNYTGSLEMGVAPFQSRTGYLGHTVVCGKHY